MGSLLRRDELIIRKEGKHGHGLRILFLVDSLQRLSSLAKEYKRINPSPRTHYFALTLPCIDIEKPNKNSSHSSVLLSIRSTRFTITFIQKPSIMNIIFTSALFALLVLPTSILARIGGHCSNNWGEDCICLDQNVCRNTWGGIAYSGTAGNFPCPDDPKDIMACVIQPCPTKPRSGTTQCLWREGCKNPSGSKCFFPDPTAVSLWAAKKKCWLRQMVGPVCPGGNDFICCNHKYLGWKPL